MAAVTNWNPAEFHYWYTRMPLDERKRRAWETLRSDQKKLYTEWWTFGKFSRVATLDIDPRTIENRQPPEPDIRCTVSLTVSYFELGEITDQRLAQSAGIAAKRGDETHAGPFSQMEPLFRIFDQKCSKHYDTKGQPLHLLLHYSVGHQVPHSSLLRSEISEHRQETAAKLRNSPFSSLWIYDGWEEAVIGHVET